jgi:probable F420-dependent oxidoreductase
MVLVQSDDAARKEPVMDYGVVMFATDYAMRPDDLARAVEERGFESLWFPEHTHIPASRRSPWPGGPDLPQEYWHTHDLFVALAMAAAVTRKLRIGSGICLVIERDPITLAKEVATLDLLSNGRLLFGIGGGWNAEEMENHGTDFKRRWKLLRERIEAMKAIWSQDNAEYHGEFVNFDPIWSWPKPQQRPHPPILLGGHGEKALERVVRYCDGWMPIPLRSGDLRKEIAQLHELARQSGRDPKSLSVSLYGVPADEEQLVRYRDAGAQRAVFSLPSAGRERVLPLLDRYAEAMQKAA